MTECEEYGMTAGCDCFCPVYMRGECHNEDTKDIIFLKDKQVYVSTEQEAQIVQKRAFELGWKWRDSCNFKIISEQYIIFSENMQLDKRTLSSNLRNIVDISYFTENARKVNSDIVENSIKQLKDKLNKI